jgi:hypothetical protein
LLVSTGLRYRRPAFCHKLDRLDLELSAKSFVSAWPTYCFMKYTNSVSIKPAAAQSADYSQ